MRKVHTDRPPGIDDAAGTAEQAKQVCRANQFPQYAMQGEVRWHPRIEQRDPLRMGKLKPKPCDHMYIYIYIYRGTYINDYGKPTFVEQLTAMAQNTSSKSLGHYWFIMTHFNGTTKTCPASYLHKCGINGYRATPRCVRQLPTSEINQQRKRHVSNDVPCMFHAFHSLFMCMWVMSLLVHVESHVSAPWSGMGCQTSHPKSGPAASMKCALVTICPAEGHPFIEHLRFHLYN